MSKSYLEPANDHLLVVDSLRETTLDGITLPDNERQKEMVFGTVVFTGPLATGTKPEDTVCYGPYAGKTVIVDGIEFRILKEGQIEGYIRKRIVPIVPWDARAWRWVKSIFWRWVRENKL